MNRRLGVGLLGAGPVTQAIHLPTLANLGDRFRVVSVMDIDEDVARRVATRCGATSTGDAAAVIDDPDVDVVAVCSPHAAHAAQVIASCEAGKTAVLCEKPLAVTHAEAQQIVAAATASGTHVVVGAMHVYDPAYRAAHTAWTRRRDTAVFTQSTIILPPNQRFIDEATELASPTLPPGAPADDPLPDAAMLRSAILGLAIHNLPLIRQFHPQLGAVASARFIPPSGYDIVITGGDTTVELLAYMGGDSPPAWTLRVVGTHHELRVTFPPSYVLAGSARAELHSNGTTTVFQFDENGYQRQWAALHDAATGLTEPPVTVRDAVDDIIYALDLADQVDRKLEPAS
jgi:myo-inositol 2-dehydrogenase/D-chiro-inositol 1-dehydrogenase